jgi:uncharacterized membrane protein YfcA
VRSGASVLLIASGVHAAAHYRAFVDTTRFEADRLALMHAMQAYEILPRWHVSAWTMLCGYSLCFAILLMLSGSTLWWMARELAPQRLRPLAISTAIILFGGAALLAIADPVPVQMTILLLAALCLALGSAFGGRSTRNE